MNVSDQQDNCYDFVGSPDLYGVGIRVGVYLSWYATLIANHFAKSRVDDMSDTNTLFMLTNIIALALVSSRQSIESVESFIVMSTLLGYFFSFWSVAGMRLGDFYVSPKPAESLFYGRMWNYRKWSFQFLGGYSAVGIGFRFTIALGTAAYAIWFFFSGADKLHNGQCEPVVFMFGRHELFGPVRTFLQAFSVFVCVLLSLLFLPLVLYLLLMPFLISIAGWVIIQVCRQVTSLFGCGVDDTGDYSFLSIISWLLNASEESIEMTGTPDEESLRRPHGEHVRECFGINESLKANRPVVAMTECIACGIRYYNEIIGLVGLIATIWTILVIELTIKWNGIRGINQLTSTSQLIPFVIGAALFLSVFRSAIIQRINPKDSKRDSPPSRHSSVKQPSISKPCPSSSVNVLETISDHASGISNTDIVSQQPMPTPAMEAMPAAPGDDDQIDEKKLDVNVSVEDQTRE